MLLLRTERGAGLSMRLFLCLALVALMLSCVAHAASPSFDCRRATRPDEKAICTNADLAKLDVLQDAAYKIFKPERRRKRDVGLEILDDRRRCGADEVCILALQINALSEFGIPAPFWAQTMLRSAFSRRAAATTVRAREDVFSMPSMIGSCVLSRVTKLGTRFGDPLEAADESDGSSVMFAAQGGQVSYNRDAAVARSRVGDQVSICLIFRPRDCPSGDDRGRIYFTMNLRTKEHWEMPDASHMCGGA
jgi:uncharacterized protein